MCVCVHADHNHHRSTDRHTNLHTEFQREKLFQPIAIAVALYFSSAAFAYKCNWRFHCICLKKKFAYDKELPEDASQITIEFNCTTSFDLFSSCQQLPFAKKLIELIGIDCPPLGELSWSAVLVAGQISVEQRRQERIQQQQKMRCFWALEIRSRKRAGDGHYLSGIIFIC